MDINEKFEVWYIMLLISKSQTFTLMLLHFTKYAK